MEKSNHLIRLVLNEGKKTVSLFYRKTKKNPEKAGGIFGTRSEVSAKIILLYGSEEITKDGTEEFNKLFKAKEFDIIPLGIDMKKKEKSLLAKIKKVK